MCSLWLKLSVLRCMVAPAGKYEHMLLCVVLLYACAVAAHTTAMSKLHTLIDCTALEQVLSHYLIVVHSSNTHTVVRLSKTHTVVRLSNCCMR
jgi:hypothetical protein